MATLPPRGDGRVWCEAIHDNILIMATDYADLLEKLHVFFDCAQRFNLIFKLSKCEIGVRECGFFGFRVRAGSYTHTPERVEAIRAIPFPHDRASARSLIGALVFMSSHTAHYSELVGPLHDLTKADNLLKLCLLRRCRYERSDGQRSGIQCHVPVYVEERSGGRMWRQCT